MTLVYASSIKTAFTVRYFLCLITTLAALIRPACATDTIYPDTNGMDSNMVDRESHWYQACMAVKNVKIPSNHVLSEEKRDALKGCDAQEFYDDAKNSVDGKKADWEGVRTCAIAADDSTVLMMIYTNGLGVRRNLPLAIKYACSTGGALAEVSARVDDLSSLPADGDPTDFDVCDHATSGLMAGHCSARQERLLAKDRARRISEIVERLSTIELIEFQKLNKAALDFAENRGDRETDISGTARAAFMIQATGSQKDDFLNLLETLEKDSGRSLPCSYLKQIDRELNIHYQRIMAAKAWDERDRLGASTVTKSDVKIAQRSWLTYRDAWKRFVLIRYPKLESTGLVAYLTAQRVLQLRELAESCMFLCLAEGQLPARG